MMSGKEKLYFLLEHIVDARDITPSGQSLVIDPTNDLNRKYRDVELSQLFSKLQNDEKVLQILKAPSRTKEIDAIERLDPYSYADDGCWHIMLLPAFDGYYLKIQYEPEYQEFTGKKPPATKVIAREIVDEFSSQNYPFVLMVLKQIASLTEFSTNNEVSYQLQSPHGQPLIQERALLEKFQAKGLFRNLGEEGIFGIATLSDINIELIKQVITEMEMKASGVMSEEEFEEIKAKNKYEKLIKEIRKPSQPSLEERYNKALNEIKSHPKSSITPQRQDVQEQNRPLEAERQTKSPIDPPSKRELRKKISNIIKTGKFGKKEKALLKYLAKDFERKTIGEISKEVTTKACTKLKACVQKKLKGTGFNINTDKGGWGRKATYQLEYLLSSANS